MLGMNFAGVELLSMRADEQEKSMSRLQRKAVSNKVKKDWDELKRLVNKRSIRHVETKINNISKPINPPLPVEEAHNLTAEVATPAKKKLHRAAPVTPSPVKGQPIKPVVKKKKVSMYCAKCDNNNINSPDVKFRLIPRYPAESTSQNPRRDHAVRRAGIILLRQEAMDCVGESRYCEKKRYICENHQFETVVKRKLVHSKGKKFVRSYKLVVPRAEGEKSTLSPSNEVSKGTGYNRGLRKVLDIANESELGPQHHSQEEELVQLLEQ